MTTTELPITIEEQVIKMKKYVSFRQRRKMRDFLNYAGYFRASRYGKFFAVQSTGGGGEILAE